MPIGRDGPATLLVVDDEAPVRRLLRRTFESEGFRVLEAADGNGMFALLAQESIDLVTLDLTLGHEDGLHLARRLRAESAVSLIMVSGKGDLIDKVVGLEVGADDYIAKPFELREVLARVRAVLRRAELRDAERIGTSASRDNAALLESFEFAGCRLDAGRREFFGRDGNRVDLTTSEFELLRLFVVNAHRALSRDQIMDGLKGTDWNPTDRTIDNHVARLRRKLDSAGVDDSIKTLRGIGYQFGERVERR